MYDPYFDVRSRSRIGRAVNQKLAQRRSAAILQYFPGEHAHYISNSCLNIFCVSVTKKWRALEAKVSVKTSF